MKKLISILLTVILICSIAIVPASAASSADSGVSDFVTRLYSICLDREPDAAGHSDWTSKLLNNQITGAEAAYGFIFSPEFQNKNVSNEQYVELMYNCFFGRSSDAEGKTNWVNSMNSGATRQEIFAGFANSREFDELCASYGIMRGSYDPATGIFSLTANRSQIEAFVTRLYNVCLGRSPEADGLNDWVNRLANKEISGTEAAYGFFFSNEYKSKNRSDSDFLDDLYNCFLGRAADADGKASWANELYFTYGGISADCRVFNGFSQSQEYTNICNSYGIDRGEAISTTESARGGVTVTPTTAPRPVINSYADELEYARQCGYELVTIDCGSIDQYTVLYDGSLFRDFDQNGLHAEICIPSNQYVLNNGKVTWTIYGEYAPIADVQYMQNMINDYRVQNGVNALPLCTNQADVDYFRARAAELTIYFNHERPNGEMSGPNVTTASVGLGAYNAFYNSPGHRKAWTATWVDTRTNGEITSAYISGFTRYTFNYETNTFFVISSGTVQGFVAENWETPGNLDRYR